MSFLFKSSPKKDTERSQPYYEWLMKSISELKQAYKKELNSKLDNYPTDEEDPNDNFLRRHPVGNIFFELQDAAINGLSINTDVPFNFKPALKLIQLINSDNTHYLKPLETKLLVVCRKQFFVVLIRKIDFILEALRTDVTLNVTTDSQGQEIDPLVTHAIGQYLLPIRSVCVNGYKLSAVSTFDIETLSTLHETCQRNRFSDKVKNGVLQIYQMIINDIKTPSSLLGGHFSYTNLKTDLAIELISYFLQQEKEFEESQNKAKSENKELDKTHNKNLNSIPEVNKNKQNNTTLTMQPPKINFGELLWRIVLLLKPEKLKILTDDHTALISQMRLSVSFRSYELLSDSNQTLFKDILQSPWSLQFFTIRQIIGFINSKLSNENREILLQQSLHLRSISSVDQISGSEPSLFAANKSLQNKKSSQTAEEIRQENTKKMLITFLVLHSNYTKNIINDPANLKELFLTVGIRAELMPLLEPTTVINLFLEADRYLPLITLEDLKSYLGQKQNDSEVIITGNILRNFREYELLLARIVEDIKKGDKNYFETLLKIPYLLYELVKREKICGNNGFLQLPAQSVLPFFAVFNVKIILETLQLLDTQDQFHTNMTINETVYKIDKNDTQSVFQRFAQFLMSIGFLEFRKSWLKSDEAILREYPFLLKDFDSNEVDDLIAKDQEQDAFVEYAELALKNNVNAFVCCPQLLLYLTPEKIIDIHQKGSLVELLKLKEMPEKVITYLFNNMSLLKGVIPGLEQYIKQQKENAELALLLSPLPASSKNQTSANKTGTGQQKQVSLSLEDAIALIDDDVKIHTERRERANEQKRRELERKKEQEEYQFKLKREEEAHRNNLAEYESKLEQLRKSKQEELAKLQLAHAEQIAKLEEEITRERQQWELELERMSREREALQKQIEEETKRRLSEKEENERNAAELARLLLEEQEKLLKESEQRAKELEELLQKQEAERKAYELDLKSLEDAARFKTAEYERAQKAIMDRDFATKQQELEQLKKQREAEVKKREEELERVRVEQEKQKEKIAAELRKREQEEKERQERAQQEAQKRKEKVAALERKELEEEQLFQQEEEKRKRQLATLEEKKQRAIDNHILNQNVNQKAIEEILAKTKKQDEDRADIERQEAELARAKKEMEEFRKRLKDEEAKINNEKDELKKRALQNEQKRQELDAAYKTLDEEFANLNATEEELKSLKLEQQEFRKQLDKQLAQSKQQETEYKQKFEENERAIKQQEEEFQRKVAHYKYRQQELEAALKASEAEQQQLETARMEQEKIHQAKLEENERKRKAEAEQYTNRMSLLEAELQQQEGLANDQLEAKKREIERVKKERESELARQQLELEKLQREESARKKQIEEEKLRRQQEQANQRKSVDAFSRETDELQKSWREAQQKRQEIEREHKRQTDEQKRKLEEDQRKLQREAEELERKQKELSAARQKQDNERATLKLKKEELAREKQKDDALKQELAEQENKLLKEREQRAAEQERKRKEQEDARKKDEERKRQEAESLKLSQSEQADRQRKIEEERARLAKSDSNYKRRQQELAAQSVTPASPSPTRAAVIGSPNSAFRVASPKLPSSSDAKNVGAVGIFPHPPSYGSPRNGTPSAKEEVSQIPTRIPKQRDDDGRSRSAKVFDPTTVGGALSTFTREEQATKEAESLAAAVSKTPPPSPKGKGL